MGSIMNFARKTSLTLSLIVTQIKYFSPRCRMTEALATKLQSALTGFLYFILPTPANEAGMPSTALAN